MLMQTQSISDRTLLLAAGFFNGSGPDIVRVSAFCGVNERTVKRWLQRGMPRHQRAHFENLLSGEYLPAEWRRAGIKIANDRLYLYSGHHVMLGALVRWPFIMQAVSWDKVPPSPAL